jgi:hypothetical protein
MAFHVSNSGVNSERLFTPRGSVAGSKPQFQRSAEQQPCSPPVALRRTAPLECNVWGAHNP